MPIKSTHPTVGTGATLLCDGIQATGADPRSVIVVNPTGSPRSVFVGGADVTTGNGITVIAGATFAMDIGPGDSLYGVAAADTDIELLVTRA